MTNDELTSLLYKAEDIVKNAVIRERALTDIVNVYIENADLSETPEETARCLLILSQAVVAGHNSQQLSVANRWSFPKRLEPYQIALILKAKDGKALLDYDKQSLRKLVWKYDISCYNVERIKGYLDFYLGENDV